jgi:hypothetical protein
MDVLRFPITEKLRFVFIFFDVFSVKQSFQRVSRLARRFAMRNPGAEWLIYFRSRAGKRTSGGDSAKKQRQDD